MLRARVTLPGTDSPAPDEDIASLLDCLSDVWCRWMRKHPQFPALYHSGVVYSPEIDTEDWLSPSQILQAGCGDCEDLTMWRCAELRARDVHAVPVCVSRHDRGQFVQHVLFRYPSGRVEDPSMLLMPPGGLVRR
jgi:hypothetical protein